MMAPFRIPFLKKTCLFNTAMVFVIFSILQLNAGAVGFLPSVNTLLLDESPEPTYTISSATFVATQIGSGPVMFQTASGQLTSSDGTFPVGKYVDIILSPTPYGRNIVEHLFVAADGSFSYPYDPYQWVNDGIDYTLATGTFYFGWEHQKPPPNYEPKYQISKPL